MMMKVETYREDLERKTYLCLMQERERLLSYMHQFEANEIAGDRSDPEWNGHPSPMVRYQVYFDYLAELCEVMRKRYNEEYVSDCRTLKQDAEKETCGSRVW